MTDTTTAPAPTDLYSQLAAIVQGAIGLITANATEIVALKQQVAALQADDDQKTTALTEAQKHQADSDQAAQALLVQLQQLQALTTPAPEATVSAPTP